MLEIKFNNELFDKMLRAEMDSIRQKVVATVLTTIKYDPNTFSKKQKELIDKLKLKEK